MKYLRLHHSQYSRQSYSNNSDNGSKLRKLLLDNWIFISMVLGVLLGYMSFHYIALPFSLTRYTAIGYNQSSSALNSSELKVNALSEPTKIVNFHDTAITSTSYLVYDLKGNMVLDSKNINRKRAIASMTKLVTALVVLDSYDLNSTITITQPIPKIDRTLGLQIGDQVVIKDLLNAMLVYSANDAAIIFANEYQVGGYNGFVKAMNEKAKELGMAGSHFTNPSGYYDTDNYSSAKDLLKLAIIASGEERITKITSQSSYALSFRSKARNATITQILISTDELLPSNKYIKGLKTGFTYASGPSFTSYWVKGDRKYLIIVMNSLDRFGETLRLFNESINL